MFYEFILSLKDIEQIAVCTMAASGRRAMDIRRIKSEGVLQSDGKWFVTLDKDKQNSLPVNFMFEYKDNIFKEVNSLDQRFQNELDRKSEPFENVDWQKLRRMAPFRLHSLRNRRAIKLILAGYEVHEVQMALG